MRNILYIILSVLLAVACTSAPEGLLSASKMEDVLYDMHLAYHVSETEHNDSYIESVENGMIYRKAVLKKHEITEAEWDSSYNYYCRHADELHVIYENVAERLRNDVLALGGDVNFADEDNDSLNIWTDDDFLILMQKEPYNIHTFSIVGDSLFNAGDNVVLSYNTQFIFQDGMKDVVSLIAVEFANDSIAVLTRHTTQEGMTTLELKDEGFLGIKSVRGYFILMENTSDMNNSTLRVGMVNNVRLRHVPSEKPAPETLEKDGKDEEKDSTAVENKDSVGNATANSQPPLRHSGPPSRFHAPSSR